jgi:membrane fusion protein (multidrug efflux system)
VSTYIVSNENVVFYDSYPGTVVSLNQVDIRGEVAGYITGIFFTDAQRVVKGQKLYEIDREKYLAEYEQVKANKEIAESNLEREQLDADRYSKLSEEDAVAKQRVEYAMNDLQNAKLRLVAAKADLTKAQTDLNYSLIVAPFDGTIGISQVKLGATVTPGQTLLNIISTDDPMAVDFVIEERNINKFQKILNKSTSVKDSTFKIILSDNSTYPFPGKISFIDRAVDPQTGTIKIRLIFSNSQRLLKAGMSCNVHVLNENGGKQIVIPYKAIIEQMGEFFVFKTKGNIVKQTKIVVGLRMGDKITLQGGMQSGVQEGDTIVSAGVQKLHDGSLILPETKK